MKTSGKRVQSPLSPSVPTKRHGDIGEGRGTPSPAPAHVRQRSLERTARLESLGYTSYRAYLSSDHWLDVKARYRASSLPQTCVCGEEDVHLHHTTYERIGAEKLADLTPLCRRCHAMVHALEWRGDIGLDLEGLILDEERSAAGRALLTQLVARLEHERTQTLEEEQARIRSLPFTTRLLEAVRTAKAQRRDVTRLVYVLKAQARQGRGDKTLTTQLRRIEARAYGWDDW